MNSQCVQCPSNSYRNQAGFCACNNGYTYSAVANQCLPNVQCSANFTYSNGQCVCLAPFGLLNNQCVQCPSNSNRNQTGYCVCNQGYTYSITANQCIANIQCSNNYIYTNGQCVCPSPYGILNGQCTQCPTNSYITQTGYCQCNPGYTLNPSTLKCGLTCFDNAYRNDLGQCVCIDGYYNQGNQCIPQGTCTNGLVWNGTNCTCPSGQVKDFFTNNCTYCNSQDRQVSNGICVCASTYYPTSTGCNACPANSHYNATVTTCSCDTNYTLSNGQCVPIINCPFNSHLNTTTQKC